MSFEAHPKEVTAGWYAERALSKLPKDVLEACNQIRTQKKEIDQLRGDLIKANAAKLRLGIQKTLLMVIVGGACGAGVRDAVIALIHLFAR